MSYLCTRVHLVWSTLHRDPLLADAWRPRLWSYTGAILENHQSKVLAIGGIADHLHIYCSLPATLSIADRASTLKSNSSRWIRSEFLPAFSWQEGYAAFTMGKSADHDVIAYIQNQEEHHRHRTFKEELLAFLDTYVRK